MIASRLEKVLKSVTPAATYAAELHIGRDLGMDSLDVMMLLFEVEKEFGVKIPEEDLQEHGLLVLGRLLDYLSARSTSGPAMNLQIDTERFRLRELTVDDVTERYLGWFRDPDTKKYITASASVIGLSDLRQYVLARTHRPDILFLGIFDKATGVHIGNIKYQPVNVELGYAIMGMLIGDPSYRGKGVAREVLRSSVRWLKHHRRISQFVLGVSKDNLGAIRAYQAAGFEIEETRHIPQRHPDSITMVLHL